jgi:hypothetical protein
MNHFKYFAQRGYIKDDFVPAKQKIPDWYKAVKPLEDNRPNLLPQNGSVKKCLPFLDAMTGGYMIVTSQDIAVEQHNGSPSFSWKLSVGGLVLIERRPFGFQVPAPEGFSEEPFLWTIPFGFDFPEGYSILATHPMNRHDLPFFSMSAMIDADQGMQTGRHPFWLKKGFEGIIPAGTPVVQLLPIKREGWKKTFDPKIESKIDQFSWKIARELSYYRDKVWKRKRYE